MMPADRGYRGIKLPRGTRIIHPKNGRKTIKGEEIPAGKNVKEARVRF